MTSYHHESAQSFASIEIDIGTRPTVRAYSHRGHGPRADQQADTYWRLTTLAADLRATMIR